MLSTAVGVISAVVGVYASYWLDVATGASIVLAASAQFVIAYGLASVRRLRSRRTPAS
ncbi:metal ABC transporter permease [Nesterenkonia pannonica]|nr:metal ABC transporter permease [Nesterenkonia pannonica]